MKAKKEKTPELPEESDYNDAPEDSNADDAGYKDGDNGYTLGDRMP